MPLLHHPVALDELYRMALLREAWTDIGDFGVVRRAGLGKIDKFSEALSHPGVDPADYSRATASRAVNSRIVAQRRAAVKLTNFR